MLDHIRIVLINTSHPGNIGSAARAMKTMGLNQLYLVAPKYFPHPKAQEMASGAQDILENVQMTDNLMAAIEDCTLVLGTSARDRSIPWPRLTPRAAAQTMRCEYQQQGKIAILFGREQSGLTNEELHCCHYHIQIPANPAYNSLNIAAALQIMAYELRMESLSFNEDSEQLQQNINQSIDQTRLATADEMEKFFVHLQESLQASGFLKPNNASSINHQPVLMTRLKKLFFRARPDMMEINILRGMLTAFQQKMSQT